MTTRDLYIYADHCHLGWDQGRELVKFIFMLEEAQLTLEGIVDGVLIVAW